MENMDFLPPSAPNLVFKRIIYMAYWAEGDASMPSVGPILESPTRTLILE